MLEYLEIESEALKDNPQGNSAKRKSLVYLPPSYQEDEAHYPVVYLLHGSYNTYTLWQGTGGYLKGFDIKKEMDKLIKENVVPPMIVVMPDCKTKLSGSWYSDSSFTGNWEQYCIDELVPKVDAIYRTLPTSENRAIAGHSMGGYGAVKLGMKYPELFSAVYSTSGILSLRTAFLQEPVRTKVLSAHGAAWSPDETAPQQYQLPWSEEHGTRTMKPDIWQQWDKHDPVSLIPEYLAKPEHAAQSLFFDCGQEDQLIHANRDFAAQLVKHDHQHTFEEFAGKHSNKTAERLIKHGLPEIGEKFTSQAKPEPITPARHAMTRRSHSIKATSSTKKKQVKARYRQLP